jgi:large subunit ribosomal protein L22
MQVAATAKYLRLSPRKARAVTALIKGQSAEEAIATLANLEKSASVPVGKVVRSAIANAENNYNMTLENLYVKEATADEGPRMKRVWMRGRGRRDIKVHRMTHITVVVDESTDRAATRSAAARGGAPRRTPRRAPRGATARGARAAAPGRSRRAERAEEPGEAR